MRLTWSQTNQDSCGAAALMVALAELGIGALDTNREMALWQRIRASQGYPGSLPGLIATEATRNSTEATIWVDDERIRSAQVQLEARAAFDVSALLREHRSALNQARQMGIAIRTESTDPAALLNSLSTDGRLLLAVAVVLQTGQINLHWLLYRVEQGAIIEMDPDGGRERPLTENQFGALVSGPTYVGVAVSIHRTPAAAGA